MKVTHVQTNSIYFKKIHDIFYIVKKMGELGGQNAHSTLNTDCESGVESPH